MIIAQFGKNLIIKNEDGTLHTEECSIAYEEVEA